MRKLLVTGVMMSLALAGTQAEAFTMRKECRYYAVGGPGWSSNNIRDTGHCAARKVGIGVRKFLGVMWCESRFYHDPHSPSGMHHSPMQYLPSTFDSQFGMFPDFVRWNRLIRSVHRPRSTILVAARYIRSYGYGPWSCG